MLNTDLCLSRSLQWQPAQSKQIQRLLWDALKITLNASDAIFAQIINQIWNYWPIAVSSSRFEIQLSKHRTCRHYHHPRINTTRFKKNTSSFKIYIASITAYQLPKMPTTITAITMKTTTTSATNTATTTVATTRCWQ